MSREGILASPLASYRQIQCVKLFLIKVCRNGGTAPPLQAGAGTLGTDMGKYAIRSDRHVLAFDDR